MAAVGYANRRHTRETSSGGFTVLLKIEIVYCAV